MSSTATSRLIIVAAVATALTSLSVVTVVAIHANFSEYALVCAAAFS